LYVLQLSTAAIVGSGVMRLKVPRIDERTLAGNLRRSVTDEDTDKTVGYVQGKQGSSSRSLDRHEPSREISLFGGKYMGSFATNKECEAFAKGVEEVLNHMISLENPIGETAT
jgi:hypothetical protein